MNIFNIETSNELDDSMSIDELVERTNFTKDELTKLLLVLNIAYPVGFITFEKMYELYHCNGNE